MNAASIAHSRFRLARSASSAALAFLSLAFLVAGLHAAPPRGPVKVEKAKPIPAPKEPTATQETLESKWGIQIAGLHLTAGGFMVDFRYKVLDAEKAIQFGKREIRPFILDTATGSKFYIPSTPKVGPLRQSALHLVVGKTYFMLFSNPGNRMKAGTKVALIVGDFRIDGLTLE